MLADYFKRLIVKNREFILEQALEAKGLMQLLMKSRNTGKPWTTEEKLKIKLHLLKLSRMIPALIIFMLPFGSLLLPFLAELLDRRKIPRGEQAQVEAEIKEKRVEIEVKSEISGS